MVAGCLLHLMPQRKMEGEIFQREHERLYGFLKETLGLRLCKKEFILNVILFKGATGFLSRVVK